MNILVTGAGGFIGSTLRTGLTVDTCYSTHHSKAFKTEDTRIYLNLTEKNQINQLIDYLRDKELDCIIHTAGITPYAHTDFSSDLRMAESISAVMRQLKIPKLFYTSGWIVYSPHNSVPFTEESSTGPISDYGNSKLRVEEYFKNISEIICINLRLASIYGPGQVTPGLIPNCVRSAFTDHKISLRTLETKRDYLFSEDLLNIFGQLIKVEFPESVDINVGSATSSSTLTVAQTVQQIFKNLYNIDVFLDTHQLLNDSDRYPDNQLSVSVLKKCIPQLQFTPLKTGLEKYISWVQKKNIHG